MTTQSTASAILLSALAFVAGSTESSADALKRAATSVKNSTVHDGGTPTATMRLGRDLFFDRRLSADGTISCAECHKPELAFSDGRAVARGTADRAGTRNTPSLINVALNTSFFWDGRRGTLEEQAMDPFITRTEHGLTSHAQLLAIVRSDTHYAAAFKAAYSVDADAIRTDHVASALASYQRTLIAMDSPFDRYQSHNEHDALSQSARRGFALFTGPAGCADCHSISGSVSLFTDNDFHLSASALKLLSTVDLGAVSARVVEAVRDGSLPSVLNDAQIAALGRFNVTLNPADIGKFRTPSLRNVGLTAPYMHDGSISTLEEAIAAELYRRSDGHGLAITLNERADLLVFLQALNSSREDLDRLARTSRQGATSDTSLP